MTSSNDNAFSDDMAEYLQAYLDETDEELETLIQSLLTLENDARNVEALNEAFRMMHSLKGSSGMMGFEGIAELAHHLESRFDLVRSGQAELDRGTMNVMLDCLDFFRTFVMQLRTGQETNEDGTLLIQRLEQPSETASDTTSPDSDVPDHVPGLLSMGGGYRLRVTFEPGLQLADLKARLIVARLANIGEIIGSDPPVDEIQSFDDLPQFVVFVATSSPPEQVMAITKVDGVQNVQILTAGNEPPVAASMVPPEQFKEPSPESRSDHWSVSQTPPIPTDQPVPDVPPPVEPLDADKTTKVVEAEEAVTASALPQSLPDSGKQRVAETVRVETDRLDRLMNLTGELVVTNAGFHQIVGQMSASLKNARSAGRLGDVTERLRDVLNGLRSGGTDHQTNNGLHSLLNELDDDLAALHDESVLWDEGRRHFNQIAEAVDRLSRVSKNLQKGVLDTRMMPVGPLFGRFKRVIRDLSQERGKQVQLVIRGEKTELDKRMIDELGDPLLHLIRNSIDHGLESAEVRLQTGKPPIGSITLEASHSGNNVFVMVRDDGAGINVEKVRSLIVERGLADTTLAAAMSVQQVIDHIWHPGFSTADKVTDISGRGVGMDIVRNRIQELNGSIDVTTETGQGTTFLLRLPLTLAIVRSLMIRFRDGLFTIPIDDVREIVAVPVDKIYSVHGRQTIEVRGEFVRVKRMDQIFTWHNDNVHSGTASAEPKGPVDDSVVNVVIVQSQGRTLGLCVDELLGGADIVIKSLADNFVSIRGLSGASITGDGTVCLMLDTGAVFDIK
ncbi:MAG: chemotaxis protein CheA [Planctomycetaceae bacterium]